MKDESEDAKGHLHTELFSSLNLMIFLLNSKSKTNQCGEGL